MGFTAHSAISVCTCAVAYLCWSGEHTQFKDLMKIPIQGNANTACNNLLEQNIPLVKGGMPNCCFWKMKPSLEPALPKLTSDDAAECPGGFQGRSVSSGDVRSCCRCPSWGTQIYHSTYPQTTKFITPKFCAQTLFFFFISCSWIKSCSRIQLMNEDLFLESILTLPFHSKTISILCNFREVASILFFSFSCQGVCIFCLALNLPITEA
jgi:hypothetical protein